MEPSPGAAPIVWGLAAVLALVLLNAYFVAAEFALVGARKSRLEEMARLGDGKAIRALRAVQHLDQYISATQLGITLASLGLGWIGKPALAALLDKMFAGLPEALGTLGTHAVSATIAFSIITVLHIVIGEARPESPGMLYPRREPLDLYPCALLGVMYYPIYVLNGPPMAPATDGIKPPRTMNASTPRGDPDPRRAIGRGGVTRPEQAPVAEGVFEFSEKTCRGGDDARAPSMRPRRRPSVEDAADVVAEAGRSRYPDTPSRSTDRRRGTRQLHPADVAAGPGTRSKGSCASRFSSRHRDVEDVLGT